MQAAADTESGNEGEAAVMCKCNEDCEKCTRPPEKCFGGSYHSDGERRKTTLTDGQKNKNMMQELWTTGRKRR